jgi:hypothetical protein
MKTAGKKKATLCTQPPRLNRLRLCEKVAMVRSDLPLKKDLIASFQ